MTTRSVAAISLLLLPCALAAQRLPPTPRVGGERGPDRPAPLPPQPAEIVRQIQYQQLRVSFETYPLVSRVYSPGFAADGRMSSWSTAGLGARVDYRVNPNVSATLDVTSSFVGGPAPTETAELGIRLRPDASESRARPFVDLRVGYAHSYSNFDRSNDRQHSYGNRYSHGVGAAAGVGFEAPLTRTLAFTTSASVMRMQLSGYRYENGRPARGSYPMTAYRLNAGIKYNPVRRVMNMPSAAPATQH